MSKSLDLQLLKARAAHKRGDLAEARAIYQAILSRYPANARARKGLDEVQAGPVRTALTQPDVDRLTALMRREEYERVIEGAQAFLAQEPTSFPMYCFIGEASHKLGQRARAVEAYGRAVEIMPRDARTVGRLAYMLAKASQRDASVTAYRAALRLDPDNHLTWSNLGFTHYELKRYPDAETAFRRALELRPDHVSSIAGLGSTLLRRGRIEEAHELLLEALDEADPKPELLTTLGNVLMLKGEFDSAMDFYDRALADWPDYADGHFCRGTLFLMLGDYAAGWTGYEARSTENQPFSRLEYPGPEWTGQENLAGKSLLLHWEQGLGDTLQFVRYAGLAWDLGARVTASVQNVLVPVLTGAIPGVEVITGVPQDRTFDFYGSIMSMPHAFGTRVETIPAAIPYLSADPGRVARWARHFGDHGFRIGICWHGSNYDEGDARSFELSRFEPLARLPGVRLISLHKGGGEDHLARLPAGMTVETPGDDFDPRGGAFLDTAAIMQHCDLVITCDTSVAHLAGGLGVRTWIMLQHVAEWRWLVGREDSPWYPTARLFRQERAGDWASAFSQARDVLAADPARLRAAGQGNKP